jgi:Concanavalin A-like lectin/glucanases superfamily
MNVTKQAKDLWPIMLPWVQKVAAGATLTSAGGGGGSGLSAHALDGPFHTGTLGTSQAPWAVTQTAFTAHASNPDAHHMRLHGMTSSDHTYSGGAALDVFGLTAASAIGRLTPSYNPGAGSKLLRSTSAGALTLESFQSNGNITALQSIYGAASSLRAIHHTDGGDHVHLVVNPGPSWSLDEQFGVDIDDNLLVRGWIVGKHAIQLPGALMICHYDGAEPFETNYTGSATGHMGQVDTESGGVIYRPGNFGTKGVQIAEATTNGCTNPSLEVDATGWAVQYDDGGLDSYRSGGYSLYGLYSYYMQAADSSSYVYNGPHFHAPASSFAWNINDTVTISAFVRGSGTWRVVFEDSGQNLRSYVEFAADSDWQLVKITLQNTFGANYASCRMSFFPRSNGYLFVDGVQYEQKAYRTPYCDGSLGRGHSWSGTEHASASSRTAGNIVYDTADCIVAEQGTIMAWVRPDTVASGAIETIVDPGGTGSAGLFLNISTAHHPAFQYGASGGAVSLTGTTTVAADTWYHVAATWGPTGGELYVNGTLEASSATAAAVTLLATMCVGRQTGSAVRWFNGVIDDLVIADRVVSADEIRAIYESNAPVFAETSVWSWRAGRNRVQADSDGLFIFNVDGEAVMGAYAGAEDGSGAKSWGGVSLAAGDILIGDANRAGFLLWDDSAAKLEAHGVHYTAYNGATQTVDISPEGDIYAGADLSDVASTFLVVHGQDEASYPPGGAPEGTVAESLDAGDILIGDWTNANILWHASAGQLKFRQNTTPTILMDTDGNVKAPSNMVLSADGLDLQQDGYVTEEIGRNIAWWQDMDTRTGSPTQKIRGFYNSLNENLLQLTAQAEGAIYTGRIMLQALDDGGAGPAIDLRSDDSLVVGGTSHLLVSSIYGSAHLYQTGASAAAPVLELQQADLSEEFVKFTATQGAGNPVQATALGTYAKRLRITINGSTYYLAAYNA